MIINITHRTQAVLDALEAIGRPATNREILRQINATTGERNLIGYIASLCQTMHTGELLRKWPGTKKRLVVWGLPWQEYPKEGTIDRQRPSGTGRFHSWSKG